MLCWLRVESFYVIFLLRNWATTFRSKWGSSVNGDFVIPVATSGLCSFSWYNTSWSEQHFCALLNSNEEQFALLALLNSNEEGFALLALLNSNEERFALYKKSDKSNLLSFKKIESAIRSFLSKTSDSHEKPKSEFPSLFETLCDCATLAIFIKLNFLYRYYDNNVLITGVAFSQSLHCSAQYLNVFAIICCEQLFLEYKPITRSKMLPLPPSQKKILFV